MDRESKREREQQQVPGFLSIHDIITNLQVAIGYDRHNLLLLFFLLLFEH